MGESSGSQPGNDLLHSIKSEASILRRSLYVIDNDELSRPEHWREFQAELFLYCGKDRWGERFARRRELVSPGAAYEVAGRRLVTSKNQIEIEVPRDAAFIMTGRSSMGVRNCAA